ncbi:MAG: ABC transporter substrate-binding protein [Peptococcaceae bacterium]|nr:ABC transporter substrate-binding protein [Peptococcaceae bacterium]
MQTFTGSRIYATLLLITVFLAGMVGCNSQESTAGSNVEHFRIAVQAMPTTLDTNASSSNAGIQIYHNIYDTLVMRDTRANEVKFIPGLAESWRMLDELTWEIKLRPNVKFHNGAVMTAEDVAYSMNRVIKQEDPAYMVVYSYLLSNFADFEVKDNLTLHAHTIKPEPLFEHLMSDSNVGISCKAYVESVGIDAAAHAPVTTAPYKVVSFDSGQKLELERFDEYWGEKAPFQKVTYTLVPEILSRITALQNKEADFVTNIPPDQEGTLSGNSDVKLVGEILQMYHVYRINMNNSITKNADLRAALSYAIDRQALVNSLWKGKAEAADSPQFSSYGKPLFIADNHDMQYDVEKAKELLARSGYNGEPVQIYNRAHYYTYADLAALAVIDMWKAIGVNAELVEVESFSYPNDAITIQTWSNPLYYMDPMGYIERAWSPEGEVATPPISQFVPSEEYIKQFEIARFSTDIDQRIAALKAIYKFFDEETPFIFLYKPYESFGMNANVDYQIPSNVRTYVIGLRAGEISFSTP